MGGIQRPRQREYLWERGDSYVGVSDMIEILLPPPKEVMFSVALVCLFVRKITEKVMNRF